MQSVPQSIQLAGFLKALGAMLLITGLLWPRVVWAQGFDDVLVTKHNLFPGGPDALIHDVCLICHVEQFADTSPQVAEALPMVFKAELLNFEGGTLAVKPVTLSEPEQIRMPQWDPQNTPQAFLSLPVVPPPFGRGDPDHRPFGPSFHCLTCHDGVLGNDVHQLGFVGGRGEARSGEMTAAQEGVRSPDHPDSILYPRKPTGELLGHRTDPKLGRYWSIPDRDENGMIIPTGPRSANLGLQDIDPSDPAQTTGLIRTFLGVIHCDTCHNPHLDQNRPFLRLPAQNLCLVCHQR